MTSQDDWPEITDFRGDTFENGVIWLPGMIRAVITAGQPVIRGRTFRRCVLVGPAVFGAIQGVQFESCNMGFAAGDIRNIVLRPESRTSVIGAIPFEDCLFEHCEFQGVGFTGSDDFLELILTTPTVP